MRKAIIGAAAVLLAVAAVAAVGLARHDARPPAPARHREMLLAPPAAPTIDVATLETATRSAPGDAATWVRLGDRRLRDRDFAAAIEAYKKGLAIDPARSETWSALGEAYIQTRHSDTPAMPADAKTAFVKALAIDPDDMRANFYAIMERDFAGEHDRAIGEWLAMLRRAPMGSDVDEAIRAAMAASINRNLMQVKVAMAEATRAQPRMATGRPVK